MAELITDEIRAWIGRSDPPQRVEVTRRDIIKYSMATEQHLEKYRHGDEAPPMFLFGLLRPIAPLELSAAALGEVPSTLLLDLGQHVVAGRSASPPC